uniref:receptor protein serine/threonine kinase n=2 Tax=Mesocestoides corti TaxID=53468 RepID=A0A5K3EJ18_MESCO
MDRISCFCTPRENHYCDLTTRKMLCDPGQQHCLLVLKRIGGENYQTQFQGCWNWTITQTCPSEPGVCYNFRSNDDFVTCCCKGDSCNEPTIPVKRIPGDQVTGPDPYNRTHEKTISTRPLSPFSNNPTLFYAVALPLLLLVLLIVVFIFIILRRYRQAAHTLGSAGVGGSSKLSSEKQKSLFRCHNFFPPSLKMCFSKNRPTNDGYQFGATDGLLCRSCPPNGTPCVVCGKCLLAQTGGSQLVPQLTRPLLGGGWLAEDELEELSQICTKVRICSRGRFGEVWLGRLTQSDHETARDVAIKVFPAAEKKSWEAELELYRLPQLKHPNILHYIGVDKVTRDSTEGEAGSDRACGSGENSVIEYWLVTDYLPLGSVYDYIRVKELSWGQMLRIAAGMARGLSYLHTELPRTASQFPKPSIAHRDFKSRNVLLKSDLTACISDLGLATRLETGRGIGDAHLQVGTGRYMAPEVLDGAIQFTRDAFLRIDVYALGLVIWELMTRAHGPRDPPPDDDTTPCLPPYMAPFEAELGPAPSMEQLQLCVAKLKKRPEPSPRWENDQAFTQLWETVQDSWDHDAEARITAGCIAGRIQNLSQKHPPSPDDPARLLPSLSSTSSINTSASSAFSTLGFAQTPSAPKQSPDFVPLLALPSSDPVASNADQAAVIVV